VVSDYKFYILKTPIKKIKINMPELPEVETTKNLLEPHLLGSKIDHIQFNRPNLRFPFPDILQTHFHNATILHLKRHGKYMLWHCDNGQSLIVHLGMTGRFLISHQHTVLPDFYHDYNITPKHEHCIFHFTNGKRISYYDPRRFGFFDCVPTDQLYQNKFLKILGLDGLGLIGQEDALFDKIKTKKSPIKNLLLDQSIIAGVGNIYASEALWRAKIHPTTLGMHLKKSHIKLLTQYIDAILRESIKGGGSTLKDYRNPEGDSGHYQTGFKVYDCVGKPCKDQNCTGIIEKIVQSNRATFFCNQCQLVLSN
jgi:formamidopyrimidine-DNA glycosylase